MYNRKKRFKIISFCKTFLNMLCIYLFLKTSTVFTAKLRSKPILYINKKISLCPTFYNNELNLNGFKYILVKGLYNVEVITDFLDIINKASRLYPCKITEKINLFQQYFKKVAVVTCLFKNTLSYNYERKFHVFIFSVNICCH